MEIISSYSRSRIMLYLYIFFDQLHCKEVFIFFGNVQSLASQSYFFGVAQTCVCYHLVSSKACEVLDLQGYDRPLP